MAAPAHLPSVGWAPLPRRTLGIYPPPSSSCASASPCQALGGPGLKSRKELELEQTQAGAGGQGEDLCSASLGARAHYCWMRDPPQHLHLLPSSSPYRCHPLVTTVIYLALLPWSSPDPPPFLLETGSPRRRREAVTPQSPRSGGSQPSPPQGRATASHTQLMN